MDTPTDAQAVRAVLQGQPELYAVLVRRYQDVLFAHAVRMVGERDEAADVVQRAFVRGFTRLGGCKDPARVGGWLFRILANECRDRLRARRDLSLETLPPLPDPAAGDPDEDAHAEELRARLDAALDRLEPEQREAFVMKHVEGRSYEEMAPLLGATVGALKMRVHRAREGLRHLLEVYR